MSSNASRLLIYTGAPLSNSLAWDEDHLTAPLHPCFLTPGSPIQSKTKSTTDKAPSWRFLPLEKHHLPTGLTQPTHPNPTYTNLPEPILAKTSFLSLPSSSQDCKSTQFLSDPEENTSDVLSQYYEHSFAIHNDLLSSQVLPASSFSPPPSTCSSYIDSSTSFASSVDIPRQISLDRFANTTIMHLADIPTAKYLHSINPQTMTVNLLVGVIARPAPRLITTRKDQRTVELVEMTVGDETRAGFGVNVWLPSSSLQQQQQLEQRFGRPRDKQVRLLEEQMEDLRPGDIVLMRNVALASFRGQVYGQTLRRGMTSVELVYRVLVDVEDRGGLFDGRDLDGGGKWLDKLKTVREWVVQFVGGHDNGAAIKSGKRAVRPKQKKWLRDLPEDTQ
ncbi:MAG: hypothetical protein Q9219_002189 [cf. Caloplaca sp. 3 TL-2023]